MYLCVAQAITIVAADTTPENMSERIVLRSCTDTALPPLAENPKGKRDKNGNEQKDYRKDK
jgi:hypothetical protein